MSPWPGRLGNHSSCFGHEHFHSQDLFASYQCLSQNSYDVTGSSENLVIP